MKILILRFSSIGDIVLTTPVVRGLKLQTGAIIHYATKPQFKNILASNPYVDKVHVLSGDSASFAAELKSEKFEVVIDLHHNLRTSIIKTRLGVRAYSFNKLNVEKWLMVNLKINRLPSVHIVDRYLETVAALGVVNDGKGLDYFIPAADEIEIGTLPLTHHSGYVAYAIGGQHYTKKLPIDKMIELCEKINKPLVLLGGKDDSQNGEQIRLHFESKNSKYIFNACGLFSLAQSASLLKNATAVFTHDTGLMHIAAALQKKVFAIWGNTIPEFGMYPYHTSFVNLENKNLSCRPCSKIGYEKCPKGHFKCMKDQSFEFVL